MTLYDATTQAYKSESELVKIEHFGNRVKRDGYEDFHIADVHDIFGMIDYCLQAGEHEDQIFEAVQRLALRFPELDIPSLAQDLENLSISLSSNLTEDTRPLFTPEFAKRIKETIENVTEKSSHNRKLSMTYLNAVQPSYDSHFYRKNPRFGVTSLSAKTEIIFKGGRKSVEQELGISEPESQ